MKTKYTVKQISRMSGLSVRALHHFDAIGLLKPSRADNGYRYYSGRDLLKLQQILFYRELDFPLEEIRKILSNPSFNALKSLQRHRQMLSNSISRNMTLLGTIDKTIKSLKEGGKMLRDEDLYAGFSKEEVKKFKGYEKEAEQRWDPKMVKESQQRVRSMSKEKWESVKKEGDDITRELASLAKAGKSPESKETQDAIHRHYMHLHNFYTPNPEMYRGLGLMYSQDERFRAFYENYGKNLADFITKAIVYFCDNLK